MMFLGIALAIVESFFLSFGTQFQHIGVRANLEGSEHGFRAANVLPLFRNRRWLIGGVLLTLAACFHFAALAVAPLVVVQPIGILGLVVTALINARYTGVRINFRAWRSIALCVIGIAAFVTLAALFSNEPELSDHRVIVVLLTLVFLLVITGGAYLFFSRYMTPLAIIFLSGVIHGFDANLIKSIVSRFEAQQFNWLTLLCVLGLVTGYCFGFYLTQKSYSVASPDVVLSGLTVLDPMVAVIAGVALLDEAAGAPGWSFMVAALIGLVAIGGVVGLERNAAQLLRDSPD